MKPSIIRQIQHCIAEFAEDIRLTWKFLILYLLTIAIIIVAIFNLAMPVQQAYYRYKAWTEPDRYGKCLICYENYPHKKMKDYIGYRWVCDTEGETNNCEGLYTYKNIKARLKDIDADSNK